MTIVICNGIVIMIFLIMRLMFMVKLKAQSHWNSVLLKMRAGKFHLFSALSLLGWGNSGKCGGGGKVWWWRRGKRIGWRRWRGRPGEEGGLGELGMRALGSLESTSTLPKRCILGVLHWQGWGYQEGHKEEHEHFHRFFSQRNSFCNKFLLTVIANIEQWSLIVI